MTGHRMAMLAAGLALVVVRWLWGIAVSEDYKAFCAELDGYRAAARRPGSEPVVLIDDGIQLLGVSRRPV
jgi:hypothetical protein